MTNRTHINTAGIVISREGLDALSVDKLIENGMNLVEEIAVLRAALNFTEYRLLQVMRDEGAQELFHPSVECKGKFSATAWDYGKLASLREILEPEQIAEVYTPEHKEEVTISEKWDMRKAKGLMRFGERVKQIIEGATLPKEATSITLKRKKRKSDDSMD